MNATKSFFSNRRLLLFRGLCAAAVLTLLSATARAQDFSISTLTPNNAVVVDVNALVGDDRGGIAVSGSQVFLTGDNATARFNRDSLGGGVSLGVIRDGLVNNLADSKVYHLADASANPLPRNGGTFAKLIELDGGTGAPNGTVITLSTPITLTGTDTGSSVGIFAGWNRVVIHTGSRVFRVSLPTGTVTDLGALGVPNRRASENWAYWGVAENVGAETYIVYVQNETTITRLRVSDGQTSTVATFVNLNDMASFTISVAQNRWYWHHESSSQFGPAQEALGYADASFVASPTPPTISSQPVAVTVTEGQPASFSVSASGTGPLTYQWYKNGSPIGGATASTYSIAATVLADAGSYSVVVTGTAGNVSSSVAVLTVQPVVPNTPPSFTLRTVNAANLNLVVNGSFENTFASGTPPWTVTDGAHPPLASSTIAIQPNGVNLGFFTTLATAGTMSATHAFSGTTPGTITISQAGIALPSSSGIALTFNYRAGWNTIGSTATSDRVFRVVVTPTVGSPVIQTLLSIPAGSSGNPGSQSVTVDLTAFAGQTVTLSFEAIIPAGDTDNGALQLDNVAISSTTTAVTVFENSGPSTTLNYAQNILAGSVSEPGQTVSFTVTHTSPLAFFTVQPAISPAGTLTFTPAANFNGPVTVTVTAVDTGGRANGGDDDSAAQIFTINVTPVNSAPGLSFLTGNVVVNEGGADTTTGPIPHATITSGAPDESEVPFVVSVNNNNTSLFTDLLGQPNIASDGKLTFTTRAHSNGVATVTLVVGDNAGTANGGVDRTTRTFTITVTPVNTAPTVALTNTTVTVLEDSGVTTVPGLVLFNVGAPNESSQSITNVTVTIVSNPTLFSVPPAVSLNGTLTFTPAPNRSGIATVTVTAQDNGGTENTGVNSGTSELLTINVTAVNDAPTISFSPNVVRAEDSLPFTASGFALFNAGPNESQAPESQTVTVVSTSNNSSNLFSVQPTIDNNGNLTFTAALNANGVATVTLVVQDTGGTDNGGVNRGTNTFTITLTPVNDQPSFMLNNALLGNDGLRTNVTVWGTSIYGQTTLPANLGAVTSLSAGLRHDLAVRSDGSVAAWGRNSEGQATVPAGLSGVTAVAAGGYHSLARKSDGTVVAWGFDGDGQATVPAGLSGVTAVAAGGFHSLALKSDGTVVAWGSNSDGQRTLPVGLYLSGVPPVPVTVIAIAAGERHSMALRSDGTVVVWGGAANLRDLVTPGVNSGAAVTAIAAGAYHNLAVKAGAVVAWGDNSSGQLGGVPTLTDATAVAAGEFHSVALRQGGTVVAWGDNREGQTMVPAGLSGVTAVAAGGSHSLALVVSGSLTPVNTLTVLANGGAQTVSLLATNISAGPADESGQTVSFTVTTVTTVTTPLNTTLFTVQPAISAAGTLTFTLAPNTIGSAVVTVTAVDNGGAPGNTSASQTFTLTVINANRAPTIAFSPTPVSVPESTTPSPYSGFATFTAGPLGEPVQTVTVVEVSNNNPTLFSAQPTLTGSGLTRDLAFVPLADANGVATVTVTVEDNGGTASGGVNHATSTFTITVTPVNNRPSITFATNNVVVLEDSGARSDSGQAIFSTGPANESGQSITNVVTENNNTGLFSVQPSVSSSGTLTFTPAPNANGFATVTLVAQDNGGTDNGGLNLSLPAIYTFTITVTAVNDVPVVTFTPANALVVAENTTPLPVSGFISFSVGPSDESPQSSTLSVVDVSNNNSSLFSAQPLVDNNGLLTFTPALNANGVATVTFTVDDGGGIANGGVNRTTTNFTITVTPVNNRPTVSLTNNSITVLEDSGARSIPGLALFTVGPANESGQSITNVTVTGYDPALFSVPPTFALNGTLTFTPAPNRFSIGTTFTVTVQDNGGTEGGGQNTSLPPVPVTYTILITPVNDAPTISFAPNVVRAEDSGAYSAGGFATFGPGPLESDTVTVVAELVSNTNPGLFSVQPAVNNAGTLTFTAAANAVGVATVTVVVEDNGGTANGGVNRATNTFTITLTPVNDAPGFLLNNGLLGNGGLRTNVTAWGYSFFGQTTLPAGMSYVTALSAGSGHDLAVRSDGSVAAWGRNTEGQTTLPPGLSGVTAVAAGGYHSLALKSDGTVVAWGFDGNGQAAVPVGLSGVTAIAAGGYHSLARKSDGTVVAWGYNGDGQAVVPGDLYVNGMTPVTVIAIAAGERHSIALRSDGTVVAWGFNGNGQASVPLTLSGVTAIAAGANHSLAVKSDGTVVAWGDNSSGQVSGALTLSGVTAVAAGESHSLALKSDGTVVAWGDNGEGQTTVPAGLVGVTAIAAGGTHNLALTRTGSGASLDTINVLTVLSGTSAQSVSLLATNISAGPADESSQTVSFTVVNGNNALFTVQPAISAAGTLTFTLAANASGSAVVTVTAVDNGGTPGVNTSAAQTFTITVVQANRAPTIAYIAPVAVSPTATNITVVESSATFSAITIATFTTGGDSGQSITTVVTSNSNSNLFSGQPIVANDGKLTFTPAPNINGVATVTVTVEDDGGTANGGVNRTTSTFTITVTPVNNLPVVTFATNNVVVLEDSGPRSVSGQAIFSTGPANESGQSITNVTATIAAPDEALFSVLPAVSLNGTLTFTPAPNANGVVTVTVVAKDNGGELLPDVNTSVAQTFTITLTPVNDAPTIAFAPANVVAAEGSTPPGATIATFTTGADSGQTISTVVTSNSRSNLFSVQPTVNTSGLLTFTPAPTSNGVATVTVTVTDSGDSANGGVNSTTSTFTITVTPVNSAPTITLATNNVVVLEDSGARTIAGLAVITTGPADESGQTITNLVTSNSRSSLFSVQPSVSANGTLTFTPAPNTNGTATLTVTAEDNGGTAGGGGNRTTSVFTITVLPVNDAPSFALRAVSTLNSVNNGSFESGDFTGWTVSDTANTTPSLAVRADPANLGLFDAGATDGTRSATHGFSGATAGTISIAQDVTVPAGGTLTFTYRASWNVSAAATANRTFRLVVQPAGGGAELFGTNLVSAAPGSFFIQPANQTVSVDLSAFGGQAVRLAFVATIPTGDTGTGSLQLDNVQLVTSSTDFVVNVNSGTSTTTTFATSIVSGPPNESEQVVSFLVTNDNNPLFSSQPAIAANGTLTFTPAPNAAGVAIVTVRARDNGGTLDGGADTSPAQTFTITVIARTGVNDAPSASFTTSLIEVMTNGAPVTLPGFATFSPGPADESAQTTTFTVANDNNGIFLAQPTITAGALTFTPSVLSSGSATVTVTTTDNGGTANGGVNVGVNTFVIRVNSARVYVDSSATVVAGGTVTVPVRLLAGGNENGLGFTLTFDPALLTLTSLSIPTSGLNTDLSLTRNDSQLASGRAGVVLFKAINTAFTAGDHLMLNATFSVLASAPAGSTPIGISSAVVNRQVTDPIGNLVTTVGYNDGSVTIIESAGATGFEGDVNGNGTVDLTDVAQIGRYVAGLDPIPSFGVGSVFQRADTAPTLGDGRVTVADYVQAQLYAAGAPLVAAGGPTLQAAAVAASRSAQSVSSPRNVRVVGGSLIAGQVNSVTVQVDAQGTEAGLGLSLTFDPTALTFVSAARGSGVPAGSLTVNSTKAAAGKLGLVLVLPAGQSLAAGTRDVITLTFNVTGSGTTAINAVANGSVAREVADVNANVLSASYAGASFNIILPAGLKAAGMERAADGSLRLVVRNTDGTPVTAAQAAKYVVHVTSNLGGAWTLLPNALVVENGSLKIVDPAANAAGLRLYKLVETP